MKLKTFLIGVVVFIVVSTAGLTGIVAGVMLSSPHQQTEGDPVQTSTVTERSTEPVSQVTEEQTSTPETSTPSPESTETTTPTPTPEPAPDSDNDGLNNSYEEQIGTDPTDAHSDRDSLNDGEEMEEGTDPLDWDSDGDWMGDGIEVDINSDPNDPIPTRARQHFGEVSDSDGDGVPDPVEDRFDTSNSDSNTDGDPYSDREEIISQLDGGDLDPLAYDIRVQFAYHEDSNVDTEELEEHFADMPVENADGSTGVNLHVMEQHTEVTESYDASNFDHFQDEYQTSTDHYNVVVTDFEGDATSIGGTATIYQYTAIVENDATLEILTHEILHMTLRGLPEDLYCGEDDVHTCDGVMDATTGGTDELSDGVAEHMSSD